jgi:hypothetical protein
VTCRAGTEAVQCDEQAEFGEGGVVAGAGIVAERDRAGHFEFGEVGVGEAHGLRVE